MHSARTASGLAAAKGEVDVDGRLHLGGFPIEKIGLVTPAGYRIPRAVGQHRGTTDNLQALDRSLLRDDSVQDDDSLNVCGLGDRLIYRLRLRKRHAGDRTTRYTHWASHLRS